MYLNIVESLPDKYNDLMSLLGNRELRACLPIQELNILLEPMQKASEIEYNVEASDEIVLGESEQQNTDSDDSMMSVVDSDAESDSSLVEFDDNSDSNDSIRSSENVNLKDI